MAKINLLTIHWGKSFGAVMQTYATCKLLEQAGHVVNVINLIHPKVKQYYKDFKHWAYFWEEFQFWLFKKKYFSKMTSKGYCIKDIKLPEADYTIVGSDQVWNYDITSCFGYTFFLDFVPDSQKRIAFCSSFGKKETNYPPEYKDKTKDCLSRFTALSVRENTGCDILKNEYNLDAVNLLDPTLLWGDFAKIIKSKKEERTIFRFLLNNDEEALKCSQFISKEVGCPIYTPTVFERLFVSGPVNWLNHINNSKYIITDSFHGVAMSIIFHKQFFVFCADQKKFTRLESLLQLLNLENRYVKTSEDFVRRKEELLMAINYDVVDMILTEERKRSLRFINDFIR